MKRYKAHVSRGGQISIPAPIRHRWDTTALVLEDRGDEVLIRPLPADPLAAAIGSVRLPRGITSERLRDMSRREDESADSPSRSRSRSK